MIKKYSTVFLTAWNAVKPEIATKNQPLYFSSPGSTKKCAVIEAGSVRVFAVSG